MKNLKQESAPQSAAKLAIKAAILVGMVLVLWVPLTMIESLTQSRLQTQEDVTRTIAGHTSEGVFLDFYFSFKAQKGKEPVQTHTFIPNKLNVEVDMIHEYLTQGKYDVLTYNANVKYKVKSDFSNRIAMIDALGIIDTESIKLVIANKNDYINNVIAEIPVKLDKEDVAIVDSTFSFRGIEYLVIQVSGDATIAISGDWPKPDFAFSGKILPKDRKVTDNGFSASWHLNAKSMDVPGAAGVKLLVPVSQYQMTMRTLKYGMLIIVLTFAMFFITELWRKRGINIVQYFLAGLALVIFYSLLLSISEYMRFAYAYLIAASMTIGLVMIYLSSVLGNKKNAVIITSLLTLLYIYVYVLTQLETYSLIAGSVGLFIILAVIMYTSQRLFTTQIKPASTDEPSTNLD